MTLSAELETKKKQVLSKIFGYENFRDGQEEVVDALLSNISTLAVMPTGAGKSLCYQIPALVKGGMTIVVSPLLALMEDQVAALKLSGVSAESISSNRDREENVATWRRAAAGEISLLYMAPERLMTERMLSAIARLPITLIAIDEAHCMSQWGPAFRPEYAELGRLADMFPDIPIAAMTATADEATRKDIEIQLFRKNHKTLVSGFDRPNISLGVETKNSWKNQLVSFVENYKGASGIVYCLSRKKTEEVAELLNAEGFKALPYHAGLSSEKRNDHQNRFITEQGIVMSATIAFGMGIDKPDVRFVAHTDLPGSMEAYYQEIGRAGRDGTPAGTLLLFGANDIRMRRQFIEQEDSNDENKMRGHRRLDMLVSYCEATSCRRQTLLKYFGEDTQPCGNCDICDNPIELDDGTELALLVTGAIYETGERFGQAHIIEVLRGSNSEKVTKFRHSSLDCHGSGRDLAKSQWQSIIRQMVASNYLEIDIAGYGGLHITAKGADLGRAVGTFMYRPEAARAESKPKKTKRAGAKLLQAIPISEQDEELLQGLKKLRLKLAQDKNVPAFVIFPDKTLIEMAVHRPTNREEFAEIKGVGQKKLVDFADQFIDVVLDT
ncbi:MAG: DNA helicase RecQ [Rhizobiaceae bacterium]